MKDRLMKATTLTGVILLSFFAVFLAIHGSSAAAPGAGSGKGSQQAVVTAITSGAGGPVVQGKTECDDGIDNDHDGFIDMDDPGCYSKDDPSERNANVQCDDGIDNDNDGKVDFPNDPECLSPRDKEENAQCSSTIPIITSGVTVSPSKQGIRISWKNDNERYRSWVFKSERRGGPYSRVEYPNPNGPDCDVCSLLDDDVLPGRIYYYYIVRSFKDSSGKEHYSCSHSAIHSVVSQCNSGYLKCDMLNPADCGCCPLPNSVYVHGFCYPFSCQYSSPVTSFSNGIFLECNLPFRLFNFNDVKSFRTYFIIPINAIVTSGRLTVGGASDKTTEKIKHKAPEIQQGGNGGEVQ